MNFAMRENFWWCISLAVSAIFAGLIGLQWYIEHIAYQPNRCQLADEPSAHDELLKKLRRAGYAANANLAIVPTGVFIQSLEFKDANDVNLTGYVWQRYGPKDFAKPPGIVFPEVVNSAGNLIPRNQKAEYRRPIGDKEVIGWYFEVTLRQSFNYEKYPLDHKTVWVRMWPREFLERVLLFPDFRAYKSTKPDDTFGIETDIVLGNWTIEETFFDYHLPYYDTNFGIPGDTSPKIFPELYFNIVLKRKFINEFIINLVPLLTVAALLFLILLSTTTEKEKAERFDFSILGVVGVNSALFFVVIIAHIQLRREFLGSGLVYLEYFYLVMYFMILMVTLDSYVISAGWPVRWLRYKDHLVPKLLYWPFFFGAGTVLTWLIFSLIDSPRHNGCV
jgi:hypothetical protein